MRTNGCCPNLGTLNALNRITRVGDSGGNSAAYNRIGADTVVQVDYSQPAVSWSLVNGTGADPYTGLDQFNRLADARWFQGTTDLDRIQHGYDLAGNRQWRKNTVADAAGVYLDEFYADDGLYRLGRLDRGQLTIGNTGIAPGTENFTQEWGLDATGNWAQFVEVDYAPPSTLTQTRSANALNEIISITGGGWTVPSYDASGNMVALPLPVSPATGYVTVYDAWNRLRDIGSSQGTLVKCLFDGLGRRINHTGAGAEAWTEKYYSDSWQVLDERSDLLPPARQTFVWGARYIDELVLREKGAVRFFALQDPNWNVIAVCDVNGAVQERYNYAAYGQPTFRDASFNVLSASQYQWETLFAGYRWDVESGLYCVRYRYYNALLGVWLTSDPLPPGESSINLFEYADGMAASAVDPLGLAVFIAESRPAQMQRVLAALRALCPCIALKSGGVQELPGLSVVKGSPIKGTAIWGALSPNLAGIKEFCDCVDKHRTGCALVRRLLVSYYRKNSVYIVPVQGRSRTRRESGEGATRITLHWNPNDRTLVGQFTKNALQGQPNLPAQLSLGHEMVHAWHNLQGKMQNHPLGATDISRLGTRITVRTPNGIRQLPFNEVIAVRGENELGAELSPGHSARSEYPIWGVGVPVPNATQRVLNREQCDCRRWHQQLQDTMWIPGDLDPIDFIEP